MTNVFNLQRILLSLGMIVFVGALVVGATGAFFSDTETSTGNTFASGAIDLLIDSESHYAGLFCDDGTWVLEGQSTTRPDLVGDPCEGTWEQTDLGPAFSEFFNFSDLKPGDNGENTISLHVDNNDAYMCVVIGNMDDVEVGANCTEPESEVDASCTEDLPDDGELADELRFFAWVDQGTTPGFGDDVDAGEGDNIWQGPIAEPVLFSNESGPASDVIDGVVYPLYTPQGVGPIAGGSTSYIGLYWCYGTISTAGDVLSCDGGPVGNISQTDMLTADIAFYAEQARNNGDFTCGEGLLEILEPDV